MATKFLLPTDDQSIRNSQGTVLVTVSSAGAVTAAGVTSTSNVGITGNITISGTVDGRDVSTDGSKLDGVEAAADVTDAGNVNSAGAVMNSDYNATNTILIAVSANTPLPVAVGLSEIVGRPAGSGDLKALSATEVRTLLGLGTVYQYNVGTGNGNIVQLGATGLPAVSGQNLTSLPGLATQYEASSGTAYTGSAAYTWAHGMSVVPKVVAIHAKCVNAGGDAGYAQNDIIILGGAMLDSASRGFTIKVDTTNVVLRVQTAGIQIVDGNAFSNSVLGESSDWELYCYAYA